jgi:3-methyladenine DNA glycosylase AlkC
MLSRIDCTRDLVNVAGSILKTLLCVATVMDLDKLHDSVNKFVKKQLMHNLFSVYFVHPYMVLKYLGPSSGSTTLLYNSWYCCLFSWIPTQPNI